jgi:hypothetical protein
VSTTTDLVIRFNQTVTKGEGDIILNKADGTIVQTVDVISGNVALSTTTLTNDTATIAINDLTASTSYYVTVSAGAFSGDGGDFAGITDATTWNFSTAQAGAGGGDGSAPEISTLTPADDAGDISASADLIILFDQSVSKGEGSIIVKKASDDSIVQTVDVTSADVTLSTTAAANDTATIAIDDLNPDTGYYVTMAEGTFNNPEGTLPFAGILDEVTWNFQTTDVPLFRILTLPTTTAGATYGVRSRTGDTDVHGNGMPSGSYTVRLTSNNIPVADVTVSLSEDREWNEVVAATDRLWYRGVISFQGTDTGVSGTHTLYVPKGPSTTFRVCPEAVTLSEVSDTCTNGVAFTGPYPQTQPVGSDTVIVGTTDIGGATYWYASGLSGSGGEGEDNDGNTIPFFPVWSIPVIGVIGWYVLKREGWVGT